MDTFSLPVKRRAKEARRRPLAVSLSLSLLLAALTLIAALFLSAAIAIRREDPAAGLPALSCVSACLSAFVCGFSAARLHGHDSLLIGTLSAVGWLSLLLVGLGVTAGDTFPAPGRLVSFYLLLAALCLAGALLGGRKKARARQTRRR